MRPEEQSTMSNALTNDLEEQTLPSEQVSTEESRSALPHPAAAEQSEYAWREEELQASTQPHDNRPSDDALTSAPAHAHAASHAAVHGMAGDFPTTVAPQDHVRMFDGSVGAILSHPQQGDVLLAPSHSSVSFVKHPMDLMVYALKPFAHTNPVRTTWRPHVNFGPLYDTPDTVQTPREPPMTLTDPVCLLPLGTCPMKRVHLFRSPARPHRPIRSQ